MEKKKNSVAYIFWQAYQKQNVAYFLAGQKNNKNSSRKSKERKQNRKEQPSL